MKKGIKIYTIGFTKKSAETFFELLSAHDTKKVIDTRLNNASQLAGFAKKDDLKYFLESINHIPYEHDLNLAPTKELLDLYKKKVIDWKTYEKKFLKLLESRRIEELYTPDDANGVCLLCSEHLPHHCHRRLVAEYFQKKWKNVEIINVI